MKFVVAQETKVLGTKMAKNLEIIEAVTLDEAKEIYMTKFPKATNVYGYQKDEDITTSNEEEETMKSTTEFTTLAGTTYTTNEAGNRYYKTIAGRKTRIGKAEYDIAKHEYDTEHEMCKPEDVDPNDPENAYPVDEQAELDKEPCHVDRVTIECNFDGDVRFWTVRVNDKAVSNHYNYNEAKAEAAKLGKLEDPDEAQDPELEQIMEETGLEASDAELERNIRNEQKKPARKPRKSKDIAYEGNGVTLTAKQVDFLRELQKTEAYREDEDDMVIEDITITIGGQFEDKPMTVGAMISTLCEKNLGTRIKAKVGNRTMTLFGLTPNGKDIMNTIK